MSRARSCWLMVIWMMDGFWRGGMKCREGGQDLKVIKERSFINLVQTSY